jgi:hypothetical protein
MTNVATAKNFVLIPNKSGQAIVIRRGPAKKVGLFTWNIENNEVKSYQWLKGRIYEYCSDISPDGKHLMYSAIRKGKSYTVVSKAPWLKALSLWRNVGGYGGGLLNNNYNYMLNDGSEYYNEFRSGKLTGLRSDSELLENGVYAARLIRNGWELVDKTRQHFKFRKALGKNKFIEKLWHHWTTLTPSGIPSFWESHLLIFDGARISKDNWEWSEVYKSDLLWSENGCIYKARKNNLEEISTPELVHDFNSEVMQELVAPY